MTNWDQESNTWKTLYVKCSLDPFFFIYRLESESEKKLRVKLQKECDCRDGGGNHDNWLPGKRGDISLTGQGQDDYQDLQIMLIMTKPPWRQIDNW